MASLLESSKCVVGGTLTLAVLGSVFSAQASGLKVLYAFTGGGDGGYPDYGRLVADKNGNVYGTAALPEGLGSVYKLAPNGTESVLYYFRGGSAGSGPEALVLNRKGNLWGTACCGGTGGGVIFELTSRDKEKLIHTFTGSPSDGCSAYDAIVADRKGNFYGTTTSCGEYRYGAVFKLARDGNESLLYSFRGGHDGNYPFAGLTIDPQGNLYGVTDFGGSKASAGTVFELSPNGTKTELYRFKGPPNDGYIPTGNIIRDAAGNVFGTTMTGGITGCNSDSGDPGCGTAFKLAPAGTETILHFFTAKHGDGGNPVAGLIEDSTGNFYGTTEYGGGNCALRQDYGCGTVFEIAPDGTETILYNFSSKNGANGAFPLSGLVADSAGNLYGTASMGGAYGYGTVFEITP